MLRFDHVSDTHGQFPRLSDRTLFVVHSGDMLPNFSRGGPSEAEHQTYWVRAHIYEYASWLMDRPLIFCAGNHDFFDPCEMLASAGITAMSCTHKTIEFAGLRFYGLPNIPFIIGEWNYETQLPEMREMVNRIPPCDVLVAHCPPAGTLEGELGGKDGGSTPLGQWLDYGEGQKPRVICSGHFHRSYGVAIRNGVLISNAATRVQVIEI